MLALKADHKTTKARHVNQVHHAKQLIADAAAALIARQLRDAAQEMRQRDTAKRSAIFNPRQWDQRLKGAVGPPIGRVMLIGAASELQAHKRLKLRKSSASDYLAELGIDLTDTDFATELPPDLIDRIEAALADSFRRPYWEHVNNVTAGKVETVVRDGTTNGLSIRDMAKQLDDIAEIYGRSRGVVIAQTESSRALNAGHVEGIQQIEDDTGIQLGKTWVSVLGATTRPTHAEADGQTVATDQPFYVGGYPCMFPGDADLPPEEAINCLCTVTTAASDIEGEG